MSAPQIFGIGPARDVILWPSTTPLSQRGLFHRPGRCLHCACPLKRQLQNGDEVAQGPVGGSVEIRQGLGGDLNAADDTLCLAADEIKPENVIGIPECNASLLESEHLPLSSVGVLQLPSEAGLGEAVKASPGSDGGAA